MERRKGYAAHLGASVPIRVIPMAVDLGFIQRVEPASPDEAAEILFVGRLLKHKGVDLLIGAVPLLKLARSPRGAHRR